ncbi:MAG: hypothetical protein ACKPKO_42650, partial [Candidatus Fonsibacter sp.]
MVEKDIVQKEWQDVKFLVDAESLEANAQDNTVCEHVVGDDDNIVGWSGSAAASAATSCKNQERFLDNLGQGACAGLRKASPGANNHCGRQVGSESIKRV